MWRTSFLFVLMKHLFQVFSHLWQLVDELEGICLSAGLLHLLVAHVVPSHTDVLGYGASKENWLLTNHAYPKESTLN